ncbi:hypothetical protein TrLO_g10674 [Triparma laevis f. longispina]|uniref:Farnesyl diphosphate synthase n=1 Tax=Triparma laevis f. longispina TaxID=1714387 RepID=A0A9W7E037_9STRA|nr:hypothetical protein TrLO_g10674 [Triparma laevis f. longispina]
MSALSKAYSALLPVLLGMSLYNLSLTSPSIFSSLTTDPLSLIHDPDFLGVSSLCLLLGLILGSLLSPSPSPSPPSSKKWSSKVVYPISKIDACTSDKDKFVVMFETLKQQMLTHMKENHEMPPEACRWVGDMIQYNVIGGKLNRGITVLAVQRTLKSAKKGKNVKLTSEEIARASVLGWSIEWLQAFFLVADDVMDDSQTRRGQPCWYKRPEVGMIAINDSFLLESFIYTMLKIHFGGEEYYGRLRDLFLEVTQQTEFGQLLDLTSQPQGGPIDLNRFTETRYKQIVKYKTAFYTFYLPIAIGMITSGVTSERAYELAKKICCIMGEYFQIQDDYLDCYGKPEDIGKRHNIAHLK